MAARDTVHFSPAQLGFQANCSSTHEEKAIIRDKLEKLEAINNPTPEQVMLMDEYKKFLKGHSLLHEFGKFSDEVINAAALAGAIEDVR